MEWIKHLCIVILLCATNVLSQENCPEKCVCIRGSTVRCMFLQLDRVPSGIPPTTTVLYVYKLFFFFIFFSCAYPSSNYHTYKHLQYSRNHK